MDTVAVKSAEDARHWGVHLSQEHREVMDALVERLIALWRAEAAEVASTDAQSREPLQILDHFSQADETVRTLRDRLHFRHAAKRYGFFLQYLHDALAAEAARMAEIDRRAKL